MSLRHIKLPYDRLANRYPSYAQAEQIQARLQRKLLDWKESSASARPSPAPDPTLLSFTPAPTYTLGRRQVEPLTADELARLEAPLRVARYAADDDGTATTTSTLRPTVTHVPRGGLTTYHGPGQVVFWPIIDLRSPLHAHFTVRAYACLLEKTTIAALATVTRGAVRGFTTSNPGVWVRRRRDNGEEEERKIAALGVHLRRHVTGLGVAINYSMPVSGPENVNPWARIVACGLGDKSVTSVCNEMIHVQNGEIGGDDVIEKMDDPEVLGSIASTWANEFATRLRLIDVRDDGSRTVV